MKSFKYIENGTVMNNIKILKQNGKWNAENKNFNKSFQNHFFINLNPNIKVKFQN
jgi:hypothetical protein